MPQENNSNINKVHLEGFVLWCRTTGTREDSVRAEMILCTAKPEKRKETVEYTNPLRHRVIASAKGDKARRLMEIERNLKDPSRPIDQRNIVALDGRVAENKDGVPFVLVDEDKISFPKKLTMKNSITLQGRVLNTASNAAYASATLAAANPVNEESELKIPVCIYSGDNPRKWADLSEGKVKPGQTLKVKGPLISKTYDAGDKKMFVCSVNVSTYEVLGLKQSRTKKAQLGAK